MRNDNAVGAGEIYSETVVRNLLDQTPGISALCNAEGTILLLDNEALERGNVTLEHVRGTALWNGPWWVPDGPVQDWVRDACARAALGEPSEREVFSGLTDGGQLAIVLQIAPMSDADGVVRHIIASAIDISAMHERQTRIATLLGEVNHRTKNLLAIVQAITRQIAAHSAPDEVSKEITRRIACLSATQDLIIRSNWVSVDLSALARAQLEEHGDLPGRLVSMSSPPMSLSPQAAQMLGLALFELGCDGAKRLEESGEPRQFSLSWHVNEDSFHFCWTEASDQPVARPELGSFSRLVLDQMISAALNGRTEWRSTDMQRSWSLECPRSKILVSV